MKLSLSISLSGFTKSAVPFVGPLDAHTADLAGAWSVSRRLLASWTETLIRVRRSSDDAETDIGFGADGSLDIAALISFVGAGDGFIPIVYDQSGNGYDAIMSTALAQPKIVVSGSLVTLSSRPAMLLLGIPGDPQNDTLYISTLQSTGVRTYSCAMKSTGATWSNYGAPLGNRTGTRLGLVSFDATTWYSGSPPVAVRRNGVNLSAPFDSAPITSPAIYGVDCTVAAEAGALTIGSVEDAFFISSSISELVAWSAIADRTSFEAEQKTYFGI